MSQSNHINEEFRYEETLTGQNIRLLFFENGSGDDEIRCSMKPASLENTRTELKYNALSYVWGDQLRKKVIRCNNQNLQVGENLYNALWQLREEDLTRHPLWVDAVCINQQNIPERNEQVRIMTEVFRSADQVIGWLGTEKEHDEVGFVLLTRVYQLWGHYSLDMSLICEPGPTAHYDHHEQFGLPDKNHHTWKAVLDILERPYFFRVWIIQEIIVARRCIIKSGRLSIDRDAIIGFGGLMNRIELIRHSIMFNMLEDNELDAPNMNMEALRNAIATRPVPSLYDEKTRKHHVPATTLWFLYMGRVESEGRGVAISSLLKATSRFQATERKDKIFALIGLSSDAPPSLIDYNKTLEELQVEIATICMYNPESWGPLTFSLAHATNRSTDLPSWVPCWIESSSYPSLVGYYFNGWPSNGVPTWWITSRNTVRLRGVVFDKVDTIIHTQPYAASTPYLRNEAAAMRHGQELMAWIDSTIELCKKLESYPTGERVSEASWRSLVFNQERDGVDAPPDLLDSFMNWIEAYGLSLALVQEVMSYAKSTATPTVPSDQSLWGRMNQYLGSWHETLQKVWFVAKVNATEKKLVRLFEKGRRFEAAFFRHCFGRKYFKSQNGYIGWVPSTAEQGDLIVLFEDCSLPFVLRHDANKEEDEDGKEKYRVIGDAYVHGYMHSRPEPPYDIFEIT